MNDNRQGATELNPPGSRTGVGRVVGLASICLGLLGVGTAYYWMHRAPSASASADAAAPASAVASNEVADELNAALVKGEPAEALPREKAYAIPNRPAASALNKSATGNEAAAPVPAASVPAQQLIERLSQIDPNQGKITPEQAAQLKQNFKELVGQGPAALPAIKQFLDRNQDFSFEETSGASQVGYGSVRAGLFDALKQIGGPEATDLFVSTLRSTADPAEIAALARYLDEQAPGQYRQEAVSAARDTLEQLGKGQMQARDTGPLFQVLQSYGDGTVTADLEKSMPLWHYYATMALAGLPEGQGVPTLVQSIQEGAKAGKSPNSFALQMLAQMAPQYPEAATALVEQAKQNQISDRAWAKIVEGLAGDQYQIGKPPTDIVNPALPPVGLKTYHIASGNQNFYSLPYNIAGLADQAAQRRAVLDQLLSATQSPAAMTALQNARATLSAPTP